MEISFVNGNWLSKHIKDLREVDDFISHDAGEIVRISLEPIELLRPWKDPELQ